MRGGGEIDLCDDRAARWTGILVVALHTKIKKDIRDRLRQILF